MPIVQRRQLIKCSVMAGESSLCDIHHKTMILGSLLSQRETGTFCDVIMKVCGKEIYAHSNILAAASPYFQGFLGLELPRQFSQRGPQIIEIQIDGSESNMFYEEAVSAVIDFIYTGVMSVNGDNVAQIAEIAKIMQMAQIILFCDEFSLGNRADGEYVIGDLSKINKGVNTVMHPVYPEDAFRPRVRRKTLMSVATQVIPQVSESATRIVTKDTGTSTERWPLSRVNIAKTAQRKRGRPPKTPKLADLLLAAQECQMEEEVHQEEEDSQTMLEQLNEESGQIENVETENVETQNVDTVDEAGDFGSMCHESSDNAQHNNIDDQDEEQNIDDTIKVPLKVIDSLTLNEVELPPGGSEGEETLLKNTKPTASVEKPSKSSKPPVVVRSARSGRVRKLPSKLRESLANSKLFGSELEFMLKGGKIKEEPKEVETIVENVEESQKSVKFEELQDDIENETVVVMPIVDEVVREEMEIHEEEECDESVPIKKRKFVPKSNEGIEMFSDIKPNVRKYSCETCNFMTNKVREMSNHSKLHKFEQNTCYYCDIQFEDRDELTVHIEKHKGPLPFFCPTCSQRFKSRTMLNMHLPKHSKEKPFICEVCSAGFKWKHALKGHMITHSNKKEHLCDTCGYATAHKSQLKAHRLIHTGDLFKCKYDDCSFQCTKRQNLKYHYLTHTREKPHQCEVCGQAFSLVKNMRRHMLLHGQDKNYKCSDCDFASTRYDKLKEHQLKQHGHGTAPEKRIRTMDMIYQAVLTPSAGAAMVKRERAEEDGDGGRQEEKTEDISAAVMLQAIEEQQVMAQITEIENSRQNQTTNIPVMLQIDNNEQHTVKPTSKTVPTAGPTLFQLKETDKHGREKIIHIRPDQLQELQFLPGGDQVTVIDANSSPAASSGLTLLPGSILAGGGGQGQQQEDGSDGGVVMQGDNVVIAATSEEGTIGQYGMQYVVADGHGEFGERVTVDKGEEEEQGRTETFMMADGTIVQLDTGTILTEEDANMLARQGALLSTEEDRDGVQYAEIMVQGDAQDTTDMQQVLLQ